MNSERAELRRPTVGPFALPFYYGWVNLSMAAQHTTTGGGVS